MKTLATKRRVGIILYCASNQIVLDFAAAVRVAAPDVKMRLNIAVVYRALGTGQSVQTSSIRKLSGDTFSGTAAIQSSGFDESQRLLFKQVSFFFGLQKPLSDRHLQSPMLDLDCTAIIANRVEPDYH